MSSKESQTIKEPLEGVDFSSLPWNLNLPEQHSYIQIRTKSDWSKEHYDPSNDSGILFESVFDYSTVSMNCSPACTSMNYGTTIWEGLKCYRLRDGSCRAFRIDRNYERMKAGAEEMCIPMPPRDLFLRSIQLAIRSNAHLIPPCVEGTKLYVRPMLIGSGQQLGLYPSPEFSFVVYVSPTGNYFKGASSGLNLHLETRRARAARGGMGRYKCSGNYATALKPLMECKKEGFQDNLFLELETYTEGNLRKALIQEMSAANVFLVLKTGEIVTPSLERGTILAGITRESILEIIEKYADEIRGAMMDSIGSAFSDQSGEITVRASSRDVAVEEFDDAIEAFCTGTAAELVPIARLATGAGEEKYERNLPHGSNLPGGPVTVTLLRILREAMLGERNEVASDWLRDPFVSPEEFCK